MTPVKEPRRSRRRVSAEKKPSTALSHEAKVGVEVEHPARLADQPGAHLQMLVGRDVVEDRVDRRVGRNGGLDGVQEPDELGVSQTLDGRNNLLRTRCYDARSLPIQPR